MKKYFDYDPYNPQEVKNEIHQIDTNGLIRLVHVPAINSIAIKNFEAITPPAKLTANKFYCEYSLDTLYREANRIVRFDKSHAGQVVKVNYLAVGSPVTATDMNEIKEHLDSAVTLISGLANKQTTLAAAVASLNNRIPDDIEAHNTSKDAHQDIRDLIVDSEYTLPTASKKVKGGIKIGDGLKMTGETLNVTLEVPDEYILPTASDTRKGGVKIGEGLEMDGDILNCTVEVTDPYILPTASKYTKGGVKIGDGLSMSGETLNCTIEVPEAYSLPTASNSRKGGVKVGNGLEMVGESLNVTTDIIEGYILPTATSSRLGGVKVGNGLDIIGGTLHVTAMGSGGGDYILPTASDTQKGGIKVGNGLEMAGDYLNCTVEVAESYTLPTATSTRLGGIKVGDGLEMESGKLHCTVPPGVLTTATTSEKGLMSAADKRKLNGIEYYAQENVIEQISVDGDIQPVRDKVAILSLSGYAKKSDVASGMHVKGSVEYFEDLPEDAIAGDVWNIKNEGGVDGNGDSIQAGDNVVFTDDGKWDVFAGFIDFSNYVEKDGNKILSTNDFTNELKAKLVSLSSYELPIASASELGGVIVGSGLKINGSGVLSTDLDIPDEYTLPTASTSTKGGVKVGSGLKMSGDTLNCTLQVPDAYTLPTATASVKGGVKVGSGLQMSGDTLNCTIPSYTLTAATKVSLGGIIPGDGLGMAGDTLNILCGEGLSIADNSLVVTMVSGETYDVFTGATNSRGGTSGLVPPPTTDDVGKFLRGNGTWSTVSAGNVVVMAGPSSNSVELGSYISNIQGALWYDLIDGQPALRLRYGDRTYNFYHDISEMTSSTAPALVSNVGIEYQLGTTPSTVMGGLWYQISDGNPILYVHGKNFNYGYRHDTQTYVGDDSSLVSYLPCDKELGDDAKGLTWTTAGSPAIVTNPVEPWRKALICDGSLTNKTFSYSTWTIDFWLTLSSSASASANANACAIMFWKAPGAATGYYFGGGTNGFYLQGNSLNTGISNWKSKRFHVAIVNASSKSQIIYFNGQAMASGSGQSLGQLGIFQHYAKLSGFYIDHFRIRSKAVWTGNFTVPDATEYI